MNTRLISPKEVIDIIKNKHDAVIEECTIDGDLDIDFICEMPFTFNRVTFSNVVFNEAFLKKEVAFTDCIFEAYVTIRKKTLFSSLAFYDCIFNHRLKLTDSNITDFHLSNCQFNSAYFSISNCTVNTLKINGIVNTAEESLNRIIETNCKWLEISNLDDGCNILIFGKRPNTEFSKESYRFEIEYNTETKIAHFLYDASYKHKGKVELAWLNIESFRLKGELNNSELSINESFLKHIYILNFVNNGTLKVSTILKNSTQYLYMNDSNIGKAELFNIDFAIMNVQVANSTIQHVIPTNIKWCNNVFSGTLSGQSLSTSEIYRQLKNLMIVSNNRPEELKFYSLEMDAYKQHIATEKGNWGDKFILWANGFSNKHGLSWVRAFNLIFLTTFIFYTVIKAKLGYTHFNSSYIVSDIVNGFEFVSPIHKFSDVFGANHTNDYAKLLDVLYRLIIAYLLYQFLAAFRKYGKK